VSCERDAFTGECKRGTVLPASPWLSWVLQNQRNRSQVASLPLPFLTIINTHNSYNNKADGYGAGDFTLAKLLELFSGMIVERKERGREGERRKEKEVKGRNARRERVKREKDMFKEKEKLRSGRSRRL
jgi:hypothetical protein